MLHHVEQAVQAVREVAIIPGNLDFGGPTEKFLFVRMLPFRAEEESSGSWRGDGPEGLFHHDGRAAGRDHEHRSLHPDGLEIEVDPDDGVGSQPLRPLLHLVQRDVFGSNQFLLVRAGPPPDDVPNPGKDVLEDIGAHDGLAGDDAQVADDLAALNTRRRGD